MMIVRIIRNIANVVRVSFTGPFYWLGRLFSGRKKLSAKRTAQVRKHQIKAGILRYVALFSAAAVVSAVLTGLYYTRHVLPYVPQVIAKIPQGETNPAAWGEYYQRQWDSYLKSKEISSTPYGGSDYRQPEEQAPYMQILYKGMLDKMDKQERGHPYSLQDVTDAGKKIKSASCLTCKSADAPNLIQELGDEFFLRPFDALRKEVSHPVACSDCHDPKTMKLRVTREHFIQTYEKLNKDWEQVTYQEMRTLVCAQCHTTYYIADKTKKVTLPWLDSADFASIESYFNEVSFTDWIHPDTKTPLVKNHHPDYEMFLGGAHQSAGVACSDCHMPFVREGNVKITSHKLNSPLEFLAAACTVCHRQNTAYLQERVLSTQQEVAQLKDFAGNLLAESVQELAQAVKTPDADPQLIKEAQTLHRRAFLLFDGISIDNSSGFHNPRKSLKTLAQVIDLSHRIKSIAQKAIGKH